jgi:hypothetical protein
MFATRKTCLFAVLAAATSAGTAIALTAPKSAAGEGTDDAAHFSNKTIQGQWGYGSTLGQFLPPAVPAPTPAAAVGRIFFDGNGTCQVESTTNLGGTTLRLTSSSCTYSVDPTGFGSAAATFPGAPTSDPIPVAFVIVDHGREIDFANQSFIVGAFTAKRQ